MGCSPLGSSVHRIYQARTLEWVAISFSRESSLPKDQTQVSCTAGRFFTSRATREAQIEKVYSLPQCKRITFVYNSNMLYLKQSFGEGNGTQLQYSCLENPMDGGAWWAAVYGVAKSRARLSDFTFTFHFHALEKEMATHSSVLAWRIPGTGKPGGLPSLGLHRVGHDWSDLAAAAGTSFKYGFSQIKILYGSQTKRLLG